MRLGLRKDRVATLSFSVRSAAESDQLIEAGYKLRRAPEHGVWCHTRRMKTSEIVRELSEIQANLAQDPASLSIGSKRAIDGSWIPRWFIMYDPNADIVEGRQRVDVVVMKNMDEMTGLSPAMRNTVVKALVDTLDCDDNAWEYAYLEVSDETENARGFAFTWTLGSMLRWNDIVRYRLWTGSVDVESESVLNRRRQRPCKGVYWGNLFGPEILSRLGGKDAFIAEFEAAREEAHSDGAWLREMRNGGVFFTLSGELLDCWHVTASPLISFSPSLRMAVWLWDRLRNAGLLL